MRNKAMGLLLVMLMLALTGSAMAEGFTPGTYEGQAMGFGGPITVEVEVSDAQILSVHVASNNETLGIGSRAVDELPALMVEKQTADVDALSGATVSSGAMTFAVNYALALARGETPEADPKLAAEPARTIYEEGWSVQPQLGLLKGNYFREEELFRQGHLGVLEVVTNDDGELIYIYFNELCRGNYYARYYQNVPKRLSDYNFTMGEKKGAAWIQGVIAAEKQMLEQQSLTAEVDLVSGASNSVVQSLVPLAAKIDARLAEGTKAKYYSYAEELGGGLTGKLEVVVEEGRITRVHYDEIFADTPEEIENEKEKPFYRQSKYESILFEEPSRIGFNVQIDLLNEKVQETQDLFAIETLPATSDTGDYANTGFTIRNTAWDNYLRMARIVYDEMVRDGVIAAK